MRISILGVILAVIFAAIAGSEAYFCEGESCMGVILFAFPWGLFIEIYGGIAINAVLVYFLGLGIEKLFRRLHQP